MSFEHSHKPRVLTHAAAAAGGIAVGYLFHRHKLDQERRKTKDAEHDEVTGLPRRKAIVETYDNLVAASKNRRRSGGEKDPKIDRHSLLMIDLDKFKKYNDTHGHNAGDGLLRTVADVFTSRLRDRDVVTRWGGEEFSVLLPRATEADAIVIAEELREELENIGQISASFGVAEINLSESLEMNVGNADKALYAAKENGRNQVIAYSSLTQTPAH